MTCCFVDDGGNGEPCDRPANWRIDSGVETFSCDEHLSDLLGDYNTVTFIGSAG